MNKEAWTMNNETTQSTPSGQNIYAIGARLQSAREALGMDRKDVAAQLRLNEKVITMLEKDDYPNDLPTIFVRGYLRSYGKFLQLPDYVIKEALAPIQPPIKIEVEPASKPATHKISKKMIMNTVNYGIALTILSLVWLWRHNHNSSTTMQSADKALGIPFDMGIPQGAQISAATPLAPTPIDTGNVQSIQIPLAPQVNHVASSANTSSPSKVATAPAKDDDDEYDDAE